MRRLPILLVAALILTAAVVLRVTGATRSASATPDAAAPPAPVVPYAEASLKAFRTRAGAPVAGLEGGAGSRDSLVLLFAHALDRSDTTALRALALNAREFAWLYYPASPQSRPPYELDADLMWEQIQARSMRGITRALRQYGGGQLGYRGYECSGQPERNGVVTLHNACRIVHTVDGRTVTEPLFGSIIEHGGRFKLCGFSNRP